MLPLFWRVPTPPLTEPLQPDMFFCLVMILMIPAEPSASYLADGEVITSMLLIWSAGMVFSNTSDKLADVAPDDGLPLISTRTFWSPRRQDTFPFMSTATSGTFCNTSVALPPADVRNILSQHYKQSYLSCFQPMRRCRLSALLSVLLHLNPHQYLPHVFIRFWNRWLQYYLQTYQDNQHM